MPPRGRIVAPNAPIDQPAQPPRNPRRGENTAPANPRADVGAVRQPHARGDAGRGDSQLQGGAKTPMTFSDETVGRDNFDSLGDLLIYLRHTYGERTGYSAPGAPAVTISALSVADCLKKRGYSMTSGSYSLLEQGKTLPKSPEAFFESLCKCLAVDATSKYWSFLRYQYLYDLARRSVDEAFADEHCPTGTRLLELLKSGRW